MSLAQWGLLALLSLLWGGSFFLVKVTVATLPPLTIVLIRVTLAAIALLVVLRARGAQLPRQVHDWLAFSSMGLLNNVVPFSLIFWAETVISGGLAAILIATTPVFAVLVTRIVTADEKISLDRYVGMVLGLAGVAVLVGFEALSDVDNAALPVLACLGAAFSYGAANVFGRRFHRRGIDPAVVAFGQVAASAVMMLPIASVADTPWRPAPPGPMICAALVGLAVLCTALAYVVFFRLLATAGSTNTSLVTLLTPVSAVMLGAVFLGESLSTREVAGMALVGLGFIAIDGRMWRFLNPH